MSESSLPYRQLRKSHTGSDDEIKSSLPYRQLRKYHEASEGISPEFTAVQAA